MDNTKPLYHYTSQKGLIGIIENYNLWMTNIFYLNDSNEFKHPMSLFFKEFNDRVKETLHDMYSKGIFKEELKDTPDIIQKKLKESETIFHQHINNIGMNIFIFSLSEKGNDLSQWRGYCPDTGGFCIEFYRDKLFEIVEKKSNHKIGKCLYKDEEELLEEVKNILDKSLPDFNTSFEDWLKNIRQGFFVELFNQIVDNSPYLKDESFKNEDEYRIVFSREREDIDFDEGKTMIKPYYKSDLKDENGKLPISKIWVGPTPHPDLSSMSVKKLLKKYGYGSVDVEVSDIPYRPL